MILLDGKSVAATIRQEIKQTVHDWVQKGLRKPHLVAVLVGNDAASISYVSHKVKACEEVGFDSTLLQLDTSITEEELVEQLEKINANTSLDGVLVQLPLPVHVSEARIIETIAHEKDVDGFHPTNIGRMAKGLPTLLPATPAGIAELIKRYEIPTAGKHCVVVGRSNIVGSPISILLGRNNYPGNCTVTLCHSHTPSLEEFTRQADILIVAVGKKRLITASMVKEGAVVIDVGTHAEPADNKKGYRLCGDVDFEAVSPRCSYITPVPGGVGPMTIAMLLSNTLQSYRKQMKMGI